MQSRLSEGDLRERLTRLEVAKEYSQRLMQDQGNSVNRIGTNVLQNSQSLDLAHRRLSKIEPVVRDLSEARQLMMTLRRALAWLRGVGNTIGTAVIIWLLLSGNMSADGIQALVKLAGLGG